MAEMGRPPAAQRERYVDWRRQMGDSAVPALVSVRAVRSEFCTQQLSRPCRRVRRCAP
jgi:hypothetical protein